MDSPKPITTHLFEPQPLLENRLGAERFEVIPQKPGVYRFYDASGELLYVGKSCRCFTGCISKITWRS